MHASNSVEQRITGTERGVLRLVAVVAALALVLGLGLAQAGEAEASPGFPPHGHMLLIGADVTWNFAVSPPYVINGYDKCVELAGGQSIPLHAHHARVHFGQAGQSLAANAGHLVVPLNLFPGIDSCADLAENLPFDPLS